MTKARDLADLGAYDTIDVTATGLVVNRATTDGSILDLQRDGATVGSIGSYAGELNLGSGNTRLTYNDTSSVIYPVSSTGGFRDATVDLGYSGSRFKDFYISGGVYLGGTGAANYLDDYEEGTWTPTTNSDATGVLSGAEGFYVKVGQQVTVWMQLRIGTSFTANDIGGLPFTAGNVFTISGLETSGVVISEVANITSTVTGGDTTINFFNNADTDLAHSLNTTGNVYRGALSYLVA